jgi:hypothetical protein
MPDYIIHNEGINPDGTRIKDKDDSPESIIFAEEPDTSSPNYNWSPMEEAVRDAEEHHLDLNKGEQAKDSESIRAKSLGISKQQYLQLRLLGRRQLLSDR